MDKSRSEIAREEMTRDPIFLYQRRVMGEWYTERVFLTREEGELFGKQNEHNARNGWQIYCVPAEGALAQLLADSEKMRSERDALRAALAKAARYVEEAGFITEDNAGNILWRKPLLEELAALLPGKE